MNWRDVELVRPGDKRDMRALVMYTAPSGMELEIDTRDVIRCGHVFVAVLRTRFDEWRTILYRNIMERYTGTTPTRWW